MRDPSAEDIIRRLGLTPHPEGGWYRETFRDDNLDADGRARATLIYFLLEDGQSSTWHRVDASELWLWHAGAPLELKIAAEGAPASTQLLGPDIEAGQSFQKVVPARGWQAARALGGWTLASCAVAPGFRFEGFEMAPEGWEPE